MAWLDRYCRADAAGGGDGTTNTNSGANGAWTLAEAATSGVGGAAGVRVNVMNSGGTFSLGAITNLNITASTTAPCWFRGCNTALGDLDSATDETNFPFFDYTGTGNYFAHGGTYCWFSNIRFRSGLTTLNRGVFYMTAPNNRMWRCHLEGTAADADARCIDGTGTADNFMIANCYLKSNAAAVIIRQNVNAPNLFIHGCYFDGGLSAVDINTTSVLTNNIFDDQASHAVLITAGGTVLDHNTIYSAGGDGIRIVQTTPMVVVTNNIIANSAGFGINSSGAVTVNHDIRNTLWHSNASGDLNQIYENQQEGGQTDGSSPFVDAPNNNFALANGSNGIGNGFPGRFFGLGGTTIGYQDIGAVQRAVAAAGGGGQPIGLGSQIIRAV